jgi:hypothetical protein
LPLLVGALIKKHDRIYLIRREKANKRGRKRGVWVASVCMNEQEAEQERISKSELVFGN